MIVKKQIKFVIMITLAVTMVLFLVGMLGQTSVIAEQEDNTNYSKKQFESIVKFLEQKNTEDVPNYEILGLKSAQDVYKLEQIIWSDDEKGVEVIDKIKFEDEQLTGTLDLSDVPTVAQIDIKDTKISELILGQNANLQKLTLSDSEITTLDLTKCAMVEQVNVSQNYLQNVEVSKINSIKLIDVSGNLLNFKTISSLEEQVSGEVFYQNQKDLFVIAHSELNSVFADKKIDFSYYGADQFLWYDEQGNKIFPQVSEKGDEFTFGEQDLDKKVYCVMSSSNYPELELRTELITIIPKDYSLLIMFIVFALLVAMLMFVIKFFRVKK